MTIKEGHNFTRPPSTILGECPRCHLPIYNTDTRRRLSLPPGDPPGLYHSGCAMLANGEYWEHQTDLDCQRLRGCGYVVELRLIRPVK